MLIAFLPKPSTIYMEKKIKEQRTLLREDNRLNEP